MVHLVEGYNVASAKTAAVRLQLISLFNWAYYLFDSLPSPVVYSYNLHEHFLILYNNNTVSALITNSKLSALSQLQSFQLLQRWER